MTAPVSVTAVVAMFAALAGLSACTPDPPAAPLDLLLRSALTAAATADPGTVVASVNGAPITEDAVVEHARATGLSAEAALDDLVSAEVLAAEALRRGLAADPAVGWAGRRAMVRRWLDRELAPMIGADRIPEGELRGVYEANRHWMNHDRLVMTVHILAPLAKTASPAEVEAGYGALERLVERARALPRHCHKPCIEDAGCAERHLCADAECTPEADAIDWCAGPEDCEAAAATSPALADAICSEETCRRPCAGAADCGGEGWTCRPTTNAFLSLAPPPPASAPALGTPPSPATVALRPERITAWYPPDAPDIDPEYLRAAHTLGSPGDVAGPVRSSFGWHLMMLTAELPPVRAEFEEARALLLPRVLPAFQKARFQEIVRALATEHAVMVDDAAVERAFGTASAAPATP